MRAHELARELNISQKELVNFLQQRKLTRNPSAPLTPVAIEAARHALSSTAVATKVATILVGGDREPGLVTEQGLLDLEREAFLSLLGTKKTRDRIQFMLKEGKPLRN